MSGYQYKTYRANGDDFAPCQLGYYTLRYVTIGLVDRLLQPVERIVLDARSVLPAARFSVPFFSNKIRLLLTDCTSCVVVVAVYIERETVPNLTCLKTKYYSINSSPTHA